MIDLKEKIKTPSNALEFMCDGLLDAKQDDEFEIDMHTFGHVENNLCFGCAATCAVSKVTEIDVKDYVVKVSQRTGDIYMDDYDNIEMALDNAR